MMSQAYRLTREEAQFIDKLRELKDASAVSELSKDPRLNTIVDVNSWNGEKYLGHYQVDARNLVLELADVAVENMKRILTGKDYRLYPEDIEISSIGDNESTRSVQTAAADEVTEGGEIFDEASATVPADEVKGTIEVEAYETMSAKSIQELAVSRSTQTTVSLSNKNGSDLTLSAVLSLEETNHGLAVVPDDINQTQIIQVSVTGQQNGENADRDMTTSNSPERLAKAPISLEQNRIKEDAEKVIRDLGGTVNWGSESKMSSKHELEKIKTTKVTAPRTTLRQRTNSQASQSTKAHTQEVNTATRPSLARQPMERRASSRQLSIATPPAAVKDPEDNFRINTDINSRDSHSANISDISRAYTPSERVDALYKHWCTSGRIPVQRNRGTLPAGKSELFPNGDQSRANKAYEDMLDLMIYAQHRDVRDGFEMDVLKAWQQTDFGTKFEGDEYGALPDLRIVDKAFQRLPNDHFLLRYLVSYFSFVWVTAKAEVSFDDYKPRGAAFERFLFGICVQSDVPATHLGNTMLWRWCEFHDHGEEGRQACHKWRDETVLKGMEWKKEWEIGIKKQTQVNRSLEDLNVDLFKGGIAKPKTNNEKTLAKRNTHKSTEVESVPMTNQATASQVEDSMSPDRVTNDDLYRSPTPVAATRRNYSGRPQMITRNSVQKETNTTGHSTPIQDSIDEKHADRYVEPGNRPIAEFRRRFAESRASSLPTQSKHTEDAALRTTARIPEPHSPRSARSEELAVSRGLQRRGSVESTNEGISDGDDTNDMPIRRSGRKRAAPEGWYNQTPKKRDFGKTMWSKFEE